MDDIDLLFAFLKKMYPEGHRTLDKRFWQWKFLDNPHADGIPYFVLQSEGRFVGTQAYWPAEVVVKGRQTSAARMVDFVIEDKFKGIPVARVFRTLTSSAQVNIGINMSEDAQRLFTAAGWTDLSRRLHNLYYYFQRPIDCNRPLSKLRYWQKSLVNFYKIHRLTRKGDHNYQMKVEDSCQGGIDRLLRLMDREHDVFILKDRDYLKWRYDDCPINEYKYACCYVNNELKQTFIFRLINLQDQVTLIIMDVFYDPSDLGSLTQFLIRFLWYSRNLAVTRVITLLSNPFIEDVFTEVGFHSNKSDLGLMVYSKDKELQQTISSSTKIWFVYGDTDRF